MTSELPHSDPLPTRAQTLFVDFLERCDAGEDIDFDTLCQQNPESAEELIELQATLAEWPSPRDSASSDSVIARMWRDDHPHEPQIRLGEPSTNLEPSLLERLQTQSRSVRRFRVTGRVAEGGMGVIFRLWDRDLRRHVAMKVIRDAANPISASPSDTSRLRRFLEEAQITGQLDHPGVVPVHDLAVDSRGRFYFTMRLVKGLTLEEVFERVEDGRGEWTLTRALDVVSRACEAVAYAHSKGVVHRDLKPQNIMIGSFGETYVMDWGLAKLMSLSDGQEQHRLRAAVGHTPSHDPNTDSSPRTLEGDAVGTPAYMAPEQARGAIDEIGPRADVYSMGSVLYRLLSDTDPTCCQECGFPLKPC